MTIDSVVSRKWLEVSRMAHGNTVLPGASLSRGTFGDGGRTGSSPKAVEGHRSPKAPSILERGSPLPLFATAFQAKPVIGPWGGLPAGRIAIDRPPACSVRGRILDHRRRLGAPRFRHR